MNKFSKPLRQRVDYFNSKWKALFDGKYPDMMDDDIEARIEDHLPLLEEEILLEAIAAELDELEQAQMDIAGERKRQSYKRLKTFEESYWFEMITDPQILNPKTRVAKKFRLRFRLPFPLFKQLVELCEELDVFSCKYATKISVTARLLLCLRILGRDNCSDDIEELSNNLVAESTALSIFHKFVAGMVAKLYPTYVKTPLEDPLYQEEVLATYAKLGLPGALGSMDGTHIKWSMCPNSVRHICVGKRNRN